MGVGQERKSHGPRGVGRGVRRDRVGEKSGAVVLERAQPRLGAVERHDRRRGAAAAPMAAGPGRAAAAATHTGPPRLLARQRR